MDLPIFLCKRSGNAFPLYRLDTRMEGGDFQICDRVHLHYDGNRTRYEEPIYESQIKVKHCFGPLTMR